MIPQQIFIYRRKKRGMKNHRSEKFLGAIIGGILFAAMFISSVVFAQTRPLQVGGLPVT